MSKNIKSIPRESYAFHTDARHQTKKIKRFLSGEMKAWALNVEIIERGP